MELVTQKREKFGKATSELRAAGLIPAELYGKGIKNEHLAVPVKDFRKIFEQAGESTMIDVMIGNDKRPAIIYDVATDPVTDEILNVDLYQVRLDEKIKIRVPLEFVGESLAIKDEHGILVKPMQELEVEALPNKIPHSIKVDISKITHIGEVVNVGNLDLGSDIKILADATAVLATVTAQMTEEQEAKLAAEVKPEDVKVETEEKKAEREAAKTAETSAAGAAPASTGTPAGKAPAAAKPIPEKK